jgi:phage-related tail protein
MLSNPKSQDSFLIFVPLLAAAFVVVVLAFTARAGSPQETAAPQTSQKEVSQLLGQSKAAAAELERDALVLESFTRGNLSWQSHGEQLRLVKEHINSMGKDVQRLRELRPAAAPWQRQAIDQIIPLMTEIASLTESAIEHLNADPDKLHTAEYTEYLKEKAELATELSALISDTVKYDRAKAKVAELEKSLGLGGS